MLGLRDKHGCDRLEAACARALAVGDLSYRTVKGILAAGTEHDGTTEPATGAAAAAFAWPRPVRHRRHRQRRLTPPAPDLDEFHTSTDYLIRRTDNMGICDPALRNALRTLKLSGMLDTLDARLAQTRSGDFGHLDFLQALCEDEIARRESAALTRRIRRAKFEEQATFESFDFSANPKLPAAMLRDLAALRWLDAGESVILYGPVGVGKTYVAQALGTLWPAEAATSASPKPPACSPTSPAGTPTAAGANASASTTTAVLILDDFAMREHTTMHD